MTSPFTFVALAGAIAGAACLAQPAHAQSGQRGLQFSGTVGLEAHYQDYREPSLNVDEQGPFGGITATGQFESNLWQLRGDLRLAYGQMEYTGSGRADGIDDIVFEGRALVARAIPLSADGAYRLTPFTGYGYRRLVDELGGHTTTTGARGYDRISQYHYVPLGLEMTIPGGGVWSFKPTIEYDQLITGRQESKLSQAVSGLSDLSNTQDSGYGLRGSLMAETTWNGHAIEFGPFVRYWNIDKSDVKPVAFNGVTVGGGFEPANETTEVGIAFKFGF